MSVTDRTTWDSVDPPLYPVYRFTVDEYHRMIETGVLTEAHRVELLEGLLVEKMTRKPPHDVALELTRRAIERLLDDRWHTRDQKAITTSNSEPEPDLAVVAGAVRDYLTRHPQPSEVGLVIEVADTSIDEDRSLKARIYARAGLPAYWIVNLQNQVVEAYSDPASDCYQQCRHYGRNESITLTLQGRELGRIAIGDILP